MSCIYKSNAFTGDEVDKCSLWDEGDVFDAMGTDEDGCCTVCDDPDPSYSCESYESDNTCYDCGHDLNTGDCDCE